MEVKESPRDKDGRPATDIFSWTDATLAERYQVCRFSRLPVSVLGRRELTRFERAQFVEEVRAAPFSLTDLHPATPSEAD